MLPSSSYIDVSSFNSTDELTNTKTFKLNMVEGIISGKADDIAALEQSLYLMLNTEADQYIIYPYTYGLKTIDLIGKPHDYVMAVLPGRIRETLLHDDRVTNVSDFEFYKNKNKLTVEFVIHTIYGSVKTGTRVMV